MRVRGYSSPLGVRVYPPRMTLLRVYRLFARRAAIPMTPEAFATVAWIDALLDRLAASPARSAIERAIATRHSTVAASRRAVASL